LILHVYEVFVLCVHFEKHACIVFVFYIFFNDNDKRLGLTAKAVFVIWFFK